MRPMSLLWWGVCWQSPSHRPCPIPIPTPSRAPGPPLTLHAAPSTRPSPRTTSRGCTQTQQLSCERPLQRVLRTSSTAHRPHQSGPGGVRCSRPRACFYTFRFFLVLRSHPMSFAGAQGVPEYQLGLGRGQDGRVGVGLLDSEGSLLPGQAYGVCAIMEGYHCIVLLAGDANPLWTHQWMRL